MNMEMLFASVRVADPYRVTMCSPGESRGDGNVRQDLMIEGQFSYLSIGRDPVHVLLEIADALDPRRANQ